MNCLNCQAEVDDADGFCRSCGNKIEKPDQSRAQFGERRQITTFYYDLVGSTALSTRIDSEDLEAVVRSFQDMCAKIARQFGGTPANTMGDGGLIYFGFPQAHEDDPMRAVRAGLEMCEKLAELSAELRQKIPKFDEELLMRVGIHTGSVVLGDAGSDFGTGRLAVGETLNLGSRIEAHAPPNGVAVSDVTARRIKGVVDLESLGHHELKGIPYPVEISRVSRIRPGQARFVTTKTSTPLVGRERELEHLLSAWKNACYGNHGAVLLRGEAGIGKSRLHQQLRNKLSGTSHSWFEISGSQVMSQTAFFPLQQTMRQILELDDIPTQDHLQRVDHWLKRLHIIEPDTVALLHEFVGVSAPSADHGNSDVRRRKIIEGLCDWWLGVATLAPVVIVAEDLHWFDPSTLEVMQRLLSRCTNTPVLVIGTSRPELDLSREDQWSIVDLAPLSKAQIGQLIAHMRSSLSPEEQEVLVDKADGVPLFVEELIHARREGKVEQVPDSLLDLMTSRLDNLGPNKHFLQTAALLGREFSLELLEEICDRRDLRQILEQFCEKAFLVRLEGGDMQRFLFRHAMLQDACRGSMLRRHRQAEHQRIADVLAEHFFEREEGREEVRAHHLEQAGSFAAAVECYSIAGRKSQKKAELLEASAQFLRAVKLLEKDAQLRENTELELSLQLDLANASALAHSFSSEQAASAYARGVELASGNQQHANQFAIALNGVLQSHVSSGNFEAALKEGARLRTFARERGDGFSEMAVHRGLCQSEFWVGNFRESQQHANRALALYSPEAVAAQRYSLGIETGVLALVFGACSTWALGQPEQSLELADRAIALAREQDDVYQLCYAAAHLSMHAIMLNEPIRASQLAGIAYKIAADNHYLILAGLSKWTEGWSVAARGGKEGLDQAIEGVNEMAGIGVGLGAPGCMAVLSEMCVEANRLEEAQAYAELGHALSTNSGQNFYNAELFRSEALLHIARAKSATDDASKQEQWSLAREAALKAVDISRQQKSLSLELRATFVLSDILAASNQELEAEQSMLELTSRFDKNTSGSDLNRARAMLKVSPDMLNG